MKHFVCDQQLHSESLVSELDQLSCFERICFPYSAKEPTFLRMCQKIGAVLYSDWIYGSSRSRRFKASHILAKHPLIGGLILCSTNKIFLSSQSCH